MEVRELSYQETALLLARNLARQEAARRAVETPVLIPPLVLGVPFWGRIGVRPERPWGFQVFGPFETLRQAVFATAWAAEWGGESSWGTGAVIQNMEEPSPNDLRWDEGVVCPAYRIPPPEHSYWQQYEVE